MFPVLQGKELYSFTGGEAPRSVADVQGWFSALESGVSPDGSERWLTWIVQLKRCSTSIGYVQATIKNGVADIAWLIGLDWQGQGYATEAVRALAAWLSDEPVNRLRAHIHPEHQTSQQLARHLGMRRTGQSRDGEEIWCREEAPG